MLKSQHHLQQRLLIKSHGHIVTRLRDKNYYYGPRKTVLFFHVKLGTEFDL